MEQVIQTNLTGLIYCTRKAFHLMDKSNDYGIIINIGSIAGHTVPVLNFKFNIYPGTKHAVRATTEVIRQELVKRDNKKIRVAVSTILSSFTLTCEHFLGDQPRCCCHRDRSSCRTSDAGSR